MRSNFDVIDLFSQRPTLHNVAIKRLRAALQQQFSTLDLDPQVCVITRTKSDGTLGSETLLRNLEHAFVTGRTPRWRTEANTLVLNPLSPGAAPTPIDFDQLNVVVDTVSLELIEQFQRALAEFWGTPAAGGKTPWACVSDALKQHFLEAVTAAQTIPENGRALLGAIAAFADKTQRNVMLRLTDSHANDVIRACIPRLGVGDQSEGAPLPVLVATGIWQGDEVFCSWKTPGAVVSYPSLNALNASLDTAPSEVPHTSWTLREPDEDIFDALAHSILDTQLQALTRAVDDSLDFNDLECRFISATDIAGFLLPSIPEMQSVEKLPDWLRAASATDRMDFSQRMTALAGAQARSAGRTFNEGLPSLLDYANQQLQLAMLGDHPEAADVQIAELQVVINTVVAVAIPSGGQVVTSGAVEPIRMSLAQFALENLSGAPAGALRVVHQDALPVPEWFTADYLRLLVCQVDIGRRYPALVQRLLMTDPLESARRQALYIDQLRCQLPLQALEQKIRSSASFCASSYALVAALVQDPQQRPSALRHTTLRPLAFHAAVGSQADVVANIFVIGDRNPDKQPLVLYRPFSAQSLTEFNSWEALRAAIAQPGDLQDEVLTWMGDHARQVYANGGFEQPHILRFGQGSEFAPVQTPPPAQLALDEVAGDPLASLFKASASGLVELADRQSTSNAESRWALLQRGGWLALDSVMPFISGSAGNALWLVQLMTEAKQALAPDTDGSARDGAESLAHMLLTVALLLMHVGLNHSGNRGRSPSAARAKLADLLTPAVTLPVPEPAAATPAPSRTMLDFSWSRPDLNLTPRQATSLNAFKVVPQPELPEPSSAAGTEGLYELHGNWYACVSDAVYKVEVSGEGALIVDPEDNARTGPSLARVGQLWHLDLTLRLRGGGPRRSVRQMALENAALLKRVYAEKAELITRQSELYTRIVENDDRLEVLPIEQHPEIMSAIETDIRAMIDIIDRKNALDQQLRPADRNSDKGYAKDLQGIARRICLLEGVLLSDMLTLAKDDLLKTQEVSDLVVAETVEIYRSLLERSLVLQETGVRWSTVREGMWQRLRSVPKVGEAYWRAETLEYYSNHMYALLDWRVSRMWSSLELCFSAEVMLDGSKAITLKRLRDDGDLQGALTSQSELEKPHDYSVAEQICVLESSLREYDRASIVALSAFETEPESVDTAHFQQFFDDLSAISDGAETRLSDLIRESEEPADTTAEYVPKVTQARKRVIKTRRERTLIGRLREGEEAALGEVVEVKAATGDRVIGTYHQHAEGEWVELEEQRPKRVNRDNAVPLSELMRCARASLERVEPDIASAVRQSRRANEPEDMEDILAHKADKLGDLAQKLQIHRGDTHAAQSSAQALDVTLVELRAGESRLREQGRQLRIEMIRRQPPTASRISYLDRQREVDISRYDGRKNMAGARRNDFVQEYAIRDKDGHLLWWAHFHYASEDAAADAFTAAHLKLPEQRLMGYKAMLKAAKDNKEVVSVYRSAIGKELAQRLFLHLAE